MVIEIIVGIAALGTIVGPAVAILTNNKKLKKELEEAEKLRLAERTLFFEKGKTVALAEVTKIKEDRGVSFRDAAKIAGHQCAHCSRKCLHCAREAKAEGEIDFSKVDEVDMLDLGIEALKNRLEGDVARLEDNDLLAEIEREERQNKRTR